MTSTSGNNDLGVFQQFYGKLVDTLPMDDVRFIAKLYSEGLLPGNLMGQVNLAQKTSADKAAFFLDSVIKPSVAIDSGSSFDKLLNVMRDSEYQHVMELVKQIRKNLAKRSNNDNGLHSTTTECISEPAPKKLRSSPIDVSRLKARYLRLQPTAKTDWPKHKVTQYIRLAIVEKEDVTLRDENLNEVTKLTLQGDVDRILKNKKLLGDLREVFHYQKKPCPRLIVIMGGPGIGKTTLAHEICLKWARDGYLSEDFDAVALIPLRCVQQRSLKEVMIEFVRKEVFEQMDSIAGNRCLIILEGLDEMAADHRNNDPFFIRLIKDCTVLEEATIMITSRPHACNKLNADRQVEVVGFGPDEVKHFVKNSFPDDESSVREFLKQLNDYPNIKSMCYVPLNLVMISKIFKCKEKQLPSTLTELYQLFLVMTLKRHIEKKQNIYSGDLAASYESLTKLLPGIPLNAIKVVFLLCRLSFCGFFDWSADLEGDLNDDEKRWKDPKIIFTSEDLNKCGIEVTGEYDGLGLLNAVHIQDVPTDFSTYNFSHLTIQEFLSALYICLLPQEKQLNLIKEHFYDFTNVFMFLCGLTRLESSEIYQFIHSMLKSEEDLPVTMRCIHESNCTVQPTEPFPLTISNDHKEVLLPYDYYCLSYIISHYPVLKLDLHECYIQNTNAEMLAKYFSNEETFNQYLEVLNLSFNELTAAAVECVMSIVRSCTTLKELYINSNELNDDGISEITVELKSNKTLRTLDISECSFSDEGARSVGELLMANNSLKELDLEQNDISDNGISSVADGLQYNDTLTKLSVINCGISEEGADCLGELLKVNNALQELFICGNDIDDEGMSSVADGLQHNSTLTKLGVSGCELSAKGASYLGELLEVNNSLQELLMSRNPICNKGISSVANGLHSNSTLKKLDVSECKFSVKGASYVGELLKINSSLQELFMRGNPFGDDGLSSVADGLQCNNTLTKLDVKGCEFSVKGAISISQALMVNQTLLELDMSVNDIKDEGITAIAGSLNNSSITVLDVRRCGITFTGVRSLAAALSTNQNIKRLLLNCNPITVDEARLIMKSAVDNGVYVGIDDEYGQHTSNECSSEDDDCSEENSLEYLP